MWRWLHSLPRAIRNQFHPTGASAVCVEDKGDNDARLKKTTPELEPQGNWKQHCKASRHGKKRRCGRRSFWWMVHGPYSSIDPLKCAPVVTTGLQISHTKVAHGTNEDTAAEDGKKNCLYYRLKESLPTWTGLTGSLSQHLLPPDKTTAQIQDDVKEELKTKRQNDQSAVKSLESAFANFEQVCKKYTAVGKGMMASRAAQTGQMDTAVRLWQESSRLGHGKSQFNLAVCYETGRGVEKDLSKAIWYYRQAAETDHSMAIYNLALLYMEGAHDLPRDLSKGLTLLTHAADLGLKEAQKYLGVYYSEEDKDTTKSASYLTKAAEQNDEEAQYLLAMCYESGYGVEENACKAAHWYTKSANSGFPDAMYSLAGFHENGLGGLPVNHQSSKSLLQVAAGLGHEESIEKLRQFDVVKAASSTSGLGMASLVSDKHQHWDVDYLVKMNSCVSSPCLSDLVRQDIVPAGKPELYAPISPDGTRSHIFSQLMVPRALTELPSLKEIHKKRGSISDDDSGSDSGISFKLGSDDDQEIDISPSTSLRTTHFTLHRRNSTMPDLQAVNK